MSSLATQVMKSKGQTLVQMAKPAPAYLKLELPSAKLTDSNPLLGFAAELRLAGRLPQRAR